MPLKKKLIHYNQNYIEQLLKYVEFRTGKTYKFIYSEINAHIYTT